jgi:eukaryotic-like serine/threonine-protein kinase
MQEVHAQDSGRRPDVLEGRWQLVLCLAHHPSETVWRALDLVEGGPALVRISNDDEVRARPVDVLHLRILRSSPHPNLETPMAWRERQGADYIVLPWLGEATTLGDVLGPSWGLPDERALEIIVGASRGLSALHRLHLVHRNVAPERLWLTGRGGAVVRVAGAVRFPCGTATQQPAYLAPEQILGDSCSAATDVYALGAVAYRMLAGSSFAVEADLLPELAHVRTAPPSLEGKSDIRLARLVAWMLRKDPGARPTMAEVGAVAMAIANDVPVDLPAVPSFEIYAPQSCEAENRLGALYERADTVIPHQYVA